MGSVWAHGLGAKAAAVPFGGAVDVDVDGGWRSPLRVGDFVEVRPVRLERNGAVQYVVDALTGVRRVLEVERQRVLVAYGSAGAVVERCRVGEAVTPWRWTEAPEQAREAVRRHPSSVGGLDALWSRVEVELQRQRDGVQAQQSRTERLTCGLSTVRRVVVAFEVSDVESVLVSTRARRGAVSLASARTP